jgi:hypothetical protein
MKELTNSKPVLTVSEMAAAIGLSRDRFYELMHRGVFPPPAYVLNSHRPIYPAEIQEICRAVRSEGIGFNGVPIAFNRTARARTLNMKKTTTGAAGDRPNRFAASLVPKLRRLGLPNVDAARVQTALDTCFPSGTDGIDLGDLLRQIVRYLARHGDKRNCKIGGDGP